MQFQFDANQDYQLDAIQAVADLFVGQGRIEADLRFTAGQSMFAAVANRLDLTDADLLLNLRAVQHANGIAPDPRLETIEETIATAAGQETVRFANLSVEMETGTGKTYVYIRTALDLYRRYGLRKYIIVVPSVAIREGVLKTFQVTQGHFQDLYGNTPYRYYVYDSANLSQVRQFALSDGVEFMIMTLASFNKAANVIHQTTDRLQGETPVHLVQTARPVLILDEPQNMESEKSIAALAALQPLFALRYSATHRNPYNVVYRLTPYDAYRQGLVKRIEVFSARQEQDERAPYLRLDDIRSQKQTVTARVAVHALLKSGQIKEQTLTIRPGDDLQAKTNRLEYQGYVVEEINPGYGSLRFANNVEIAVGQELGPNQAAIFEAQIRYAVEAHFRKQRHVRPAGVKVLTLFFIDRVDNYATEDGLVRRLFDRAFDDIKGRYPEWQDKSAAQVQAAYFAQRRTRAGDVIYEDSKTGEADRDREAYDLIMKDKERLLSFDEPVAFVFSHSALREGWDNPNVCQICTLNQSVSEVKKRQEVGRGVRLVVDQSGQRLHDERYNILTVVANESYERFVGQLQSEIAFEYQAEIEARYGKLLKDLSAAERQAVEAEYGQGILPPPPANARQRGAARLKKGYELDPRFQALWDKIKHKTRYAVTVDTDRLIRDVVDDLAGETIAPPRIVGSLARVEVDSENSFQAMQLSAAKTLIDLAGHYPLPNLIDLMANQMAHTSPPVRLTRRTLLEIVRRAPVNCRQAVVDNPTEFAAVAVGHIKTRLADQLVDGIRYEKINQWYEMTQFQVEIESWQEYLVPAARSIYDCVIADSGIERQFVQDLEQRDDVLLYVKLPAWFTVPTPIGQYNPDWAVVIQDRDPFGQPAAACTYLVNETKSTQNLDELRPDERRKIACGQAHFEGALGVSYKREPSAKNL